MNREERRWCFWYAVVLITLTTVPYLLAYASQGEEWRFSGFLFGVEDGNSYIAKMMQGATGEWLFRTPYTTYPQRGVIAFLPYMLLGKLASGEAMHEQLVALFHLFRVGAIPLLVLATYRFSGVFVTEVRWRRWVTLLATAGGGLGWMLLLVPGGSVLGSAPLEFYSPETFGFLGPYGIPHLTLARALLLFALTTYLETPERKAAAWMAGGLLAALALVQPLTVLIAYGVIGAHLIAIVIAERKDAIRTTLMPWLRAIGQMLIISGPIVIYLTVRFIGDPFLRLWTEQNVITSPHPLHYLLAYGAMLPLAFLGGRKLLREGGHRSLLPVVWVVLFPLLAYAPHNLQRRLPEGVWVALVMLAALGLMGRKRSTQRALATLLLIICLPSTVLLLGGGVSMAISPSEPVFLPGDQADVFVRFGDRADAGEVALASYATSNAIPAWTPLRVIAGHGPESANLELVLPRIEAFFDASTTEGERAVLLEEFEVDYLLWGPEERVLGSWRPDKSDLVRGVIEEGDYEVFEVITP